MSNITRSTSITPSRPFSPVVSAGMFLAAVIFCFTPWGSPPLALAAGVAIALTVGNPFAALLKPWVRRLLQLSVILLGFGMDLPGALRAGVHGAVFAAISIVVTLLLATWIGRWLKIDSVVSRLIASGTAICGGSAIAAVSGVVRANHHAITVAMGTVFILNAVALLVFPPIGHALGLTQDQFGTWAGIAIHDVSSVVGAAQVYGDRALDVAVAVKLSRTLWIVPICLWVGWRHHRTTVDNVAKQQASSAMSLMPWFIVFFLLASVSRMFVPGVTDLAPALTGVAKTGLTLTLLFIGAGMSRQMLVETGWRPLLQGVILWVAIGGISLGVVVM